MQNAVPRVATARASYRQGPEEWRGRVRERYVPWRKTGPVHINAGTPNTSRSADITWSGHKLLPRWPDARTMVHDMTRGKIRADCCQRPHPTRKFQDHKWADGCGASGSGSDPAQPPAGCMATSHVAAAGRTQVASASSRAAPNCQAGWPWHTAQASRRSSIRIYACP